LALRAEHGGYAELAKRPKKHVFKDEMEAGITMKLKRGTFSSALAAMELEGVIPEIFLSLLFFLSEE
jgi:hypothetical protein